MKRILYKGVKCSVPSCPENAYCLGYCKRHYRKASTYGNPLEPDRKGRHGLGSFDSSNGYRRIRQKLEHIVIAEAALGKPLPKGAVVHHVNGIKSDNRKENLFVCPSREYHFLLHSRERALDACGNPNARKCQRCQKWDDISNLVLSKRHYRHKRGTCSPYVKTETEAIRDERDTQPEPVSEE